LAVFLETIFDNIELDLDQETTVQCDNLQTVRLLMKESPKLVTKLKHVDIQKHWLCQETQSGELKFEWIWTKDMPADGLTKALSYQKHQAFVRQLNMTNVEHLINLGM
jgi:hypothetical protein